MEINDVLILYKPGSGCDYHRILLPFQELEYDIDRSLDLNLEKLKTFKAIYFNRIPRKAKAENMLEVRKQYGMKFIADYDDYWELYTHHYLYKHWKEEGISEKMQTFMRIADVVTCTTQRLADKISTINKNVVVIPNAMPVGREDQFMDRKTPTNETRFGFVGGTSHASDLMTIWPVFQHFNHLNFTLCGYTPNSDASRKMDAICSNNNTNKNYKADPVKPLNQYMTGYDNLDCCIAPLTNDYFNQFKSNLKVLEAGIKRCAIICSANPCYTDTVPDSVVTYCKSIKDWKEAIKKHRDLAYTREKGQALYDWVTTNYNLADTNKTRLQLIQSL